jgi:hypothetical protein
MKSLLIFSSLLALGLTSFTNSADTRYYELRVYYCHPGKLNDLIARFKNHTTKIFEKHGMENVGYWLPTNNQENALYYILSYPNKAARESSWTAFRNDPVWQEVARKSEENGKIVARVSSTFMNASELSPAIKPSSAGADRSFELRTYYFAPGKLPELTKRFTDHTFGFFKKYGMENIGYWTTESNATTQPALVYMLAYKSEDAGKKAWADFVKDPQWVSAKAESEKNGKLVDSVKSVYLKPLEFSTIK